MTAPMPVTMPTPLRSPRWPLLVSAGDALAADAALVAALGGDATDPRIYFEGEAPEGTVPPFLVWGGTAPTKAGFFAAPGHATTQALRILARTKPEAALLLDHVQRVLDGPRLALDGHTMLRATIEEHADFLDPDGLGVVLPLTYRVRTLRTAEGAG